MKIMTFHFAHIFGELMLRHLQKKAQGEQVYSRSVSHNLDLS
jgi:hypothetical protein